MITQQWQTILFQNENVRGDVVKTNKEGADLTTNSLNGILGKEKNPVGYDDAGKLKYDESIDISNYTANQKKVLIRYKEMIGSPIETNLYVVDKDDKVIPGNKETDPKKSLTEINDVGATVPWTRGTNLDHIDVYVARNPFDTKIRVQNQMTIGGNTVRASTTELGIKLVIPEFAYVTNFHEMLGHAYLRIFEPTLSTEDELKKVIDFHNEIQRNLMIDDRPYFKHTPLPTQ